MRAVFGGERITNKSDKRKLEVFERNISGQTFGVIKHNDDEYDLLNDGIKKNLYSAKLML